MKYLYLFMAGLLLISCKKEVDENSGEIEPVTPSTPKNFISKEFTGNAYNIFGYYESENSDLHAYFIGNPNGSGDFSSLNRMYVRNDATNKSSCMKFDEFGRPRYWVSFDASGNLNPYMVEFGYEILLDDTLYNTAVAKGIDWATGIDSVYFSVSVRTSDNSIFINKDSDQTLDETLDAAKPVLTCEIAWYCDLVTSIKNGIDDLGQSISNLGPDATTVADDFTESSQDYTDVTSDMHDYNSDPAQPFDPTVLDETDDANNTSTVSNVANHANFQPEVLTLQYEVDNRWWCTTILSSSKWTLMPYINNSGSVVQGHPTYVAGWELDYYWIGTYPGIVWQAEEYAMTPYSGTDGAMDFIDVDYTTGYVTGLDHFGHNINFQLKPGIQEYYIGDFSLTDGQIHHYILSK